MADANEDWLDPIVKRAVDKTIDRLAKGREHIMKERSREIVQRRSRCCTRCTHGNLRRRK